MEEKKDLKPKTKNEEFKFSLLEVIILVIITAIVTTVVLTTIKNINNNSKVESQDEYVQKFVKEYNFILDEYYGEVDKDALINNAIAGMINGLNDPYSIYIDDDNATDFDVELDGEFLGLGITITTNNNNEVEIVELLEGYNAYSSGLQVGDVIVSMNGESASVISATDFRTKMIKSNEKVINLVVRRNGELLEYNVERTMVTIDSVNSKIFERDNQKIGYIQITIFAANTYSQFKKALNELEAQKIDSLIVDVRSNTGGHLSTVTDIISEFLDNTHVIYQVKDENKVEKEYSRGKVTKQYDIVVLIDGASASASELLASALKEQMNAKLVGKRSFGKSTVQQVIDLNNGSKYKITIKEWLTSLGNTINGVGINPDIEVALTEAYIENPTEENDFQLQAAIEALKK